MKVLRYMIPIKFTPTSHLIYAYESKHFSMTQDINRNINRSVKSGNLPHYSNMSKASNICCLFITLHF